ncbi:hypothetical protein [Pandoraea sp. NPDC087047]|uniref:hypothetical protein n=1 Tax=Pandoraea sp. NPDC087047 TaxID=3364390 RepID=UPI0037F1DC26
MTSTTDRPPLALPGGHAKVLLHSCYALGAHEHGLPVVTSSLGISPWKNRFYGDDTQGEVV